MTEPEKKRRIPRHLWWGVGIPLVLLVIGAFRVPELHRQVMLDNQRAAYAALESIATAEANYRSNDRDGNKVNDYWTGDVAGLWHAKRLIDRGIAEADASPLNGLVGEPVPYHGYYFVALGRDLQGNVNYKANTDGSGRLVHNSSRFGYCAYPASPGWSGRVTYIINENNTIFRSLDLERSVPLDWPTDMTSAREWSAH